MALSNVQIANGALQRLGATRVEALTQNHPNARSMNAAFTRVRDALLRKYAWSFAIKRDSIAADGTGPVWGDWSRYSLPNDYIRLIRDDETGQRVDWKIEGLHILSADDSPLEIRYLARIEDPNFFDACFVEALECKLAAVTCQEITQSTSKKAAIDADFDTAVADAKNTGAIEKEAQEFGEDDWINARL